MKEKFETKDLGEATALHCFGFDLIEFKKTEIFGQRAFVFSEESLKHSEWADKSITDPKEVIERYRSRANGLMVNALDFFTSNQELKARLLTELDNSGERRSRGR